MPSELSGSKKNEEQKPKIVTPKTENEVLKDVTDVSASQRVTRSGAKTPQNTGK